MKKELLFLILFLLAGCRQVPSVNYDFSEFTKPAENPIIRADSSFTFIDPVSGAEVKWQKADVFNPAAIVRDNKVYLLLRCEDNPAAHLGGRTSRIGLAYSDDGINFIKHTAPVLYPDSDRFMIYDHPGGCEDPRIVQTTDSLYVLTYTSWNYKIARLSIAFSRDLISWEKQGPAFAKSYNGRFLDTWSKSGSIVTKMENGQIVAAKIDGRYWMYWGEQFINLAWSDNLADWTPLLDDNGDLKKLVVTRPGRFDSALTECGPPALMTDKGIILFYNGKNATGGNADSSLPESTYSVGNVIFDPANPEMVISRSDSYLLKPTLPHEISGQYSAGTTFSEGLVYFKSKWFLYYGTADSFVGVAVSE